MQVLVLFDFSVMTCKRAYKLRPNVWFGMAHGTNRPAPASQIAWRVVAARLPPGRRNGGAGSEQHRCLGTIQRNQRIAFALFHVRPGNPKIHGRAKCPRRLAGRSQGSAAGLYARLWLGGPREQGAGETDLPVPDREHIQTVHGSRGAETGRNTKTGPERSSV